MGGVTTEEIITKLKQIKKAMNRIYKIDKIILFGSRVRGEELLTSDVDVIVISKDFSKIPFRKRPDKFLDFWRLPVDLEILCYSPEEFKRKSREYGIVRRAIKEGLEI